MQACFKASSGNHGGRCPVFGAQWLVQCSQIVYMYMWVRVNSVDSWYCWYCTVGTEDVLLCEARTLRSLNELWGEVVVMLG